MNPSDATVKLSRLGESQNEEIEDERQAEGHPTCGWRIVKALLVLVILVGFHIPRVAVVKGSLDAEMTNAGVSNEWRRI